MRKKVKLDQEREKANNRTIFVCGAFLAVSVILLQDYITTGITDIPIFISVIALSLSIPILSGLIIALRFEIDFQFYVGDDQGEDLTVSFVISTGFYLATIGVGAAFWHLSWIVGVLFIVAVAVTFIAVKKRLPTSEEMSQPYEE